MMRRQLERYGRWLAAIALLSVVGLASGIFVMAHQRLRTPFADRYVVRAEFTTSESLTPGLGQPVNVAGVRVGDIVAAELRGGRSIVKLSIEPGKLAHVHADASATLRPNTPLKDMQIELDPGSRGAPLLPDEATIPSARTDTPVDSDDLTGVLDADTRAYFTSLVAATQRGLRGRGGDLRRVLRALGPTTEQARQVTGELAGRWRQIRRVSHNLSVIARAAGSSDRDLARVVSAGNATLGAMASQDAALEESVARLPGTLHAARRGLLHTQQFATALPGAVDALKPAAARLPRALRATTELLGQAVPLVRASRPLLRESRPVVRDLTATTRDLEELSPALKRAFDVIDSVANAVAYNPPGREEGYLFWLAWAAHNVASTVSTEDAHGAAIRGLTLVSCDSLTAQPGLAPFAALLTGKLPICP